MKKITSILAVAAFMLAMNVNAQEPKKQPAKKETVKTERAEVKEEKKSCSTAEKKSCSSSEKKAACCSSKKTTGKKQNNILNIFQSKAFRKSERFFCVTNVAVCIQNIQYICERHSMKRIVFSFIG